MTNAEQGTAHNTPADRPADFSLSLDDLEDFARGAAFLGTGGGGDPYVGRLILQNQLRAGGPLRIITLADLDPASLVVCVAVMGAPTVMTEKVPSVAALETSLRQIEQTVGRRADALIPLEVGGINATIPLALGAKLGLPVVNADGMGRAFPEIQMVTFGIYGCPLSPVAVSNERADTVTVRTADNLRGEVLARAVTVRMGGASHVAMYPMTGEGAARTAIPDTLRLALNIGRIIRTARQDKLDPMEALADHLAAHDTPRLCTVLFDGKVVDVRRETRGGFNVGHVVLEGGAGYDGRMTVSFQNENLLAERDGQAVAMVPDLITIVDRETMEPITTESLRYGQRAKVVGLSVPPIMRSRAALDTFGPRAFGLDRDYQPLEELV